MAAVHVASPQRNAEYFHAGYSAPPRSFANRRGKNVSGLAIRRVCGELSYSVFSEEPFSHRVECAHMHKTRFAHNFL
jgi:hypothetical protein